MPVLEPRDRAVARDGVPADAPTPAGAATVVFDEHSVRLAPQILSDVFGTIPEIHRAGLTVLVIDQDIQQALEHAGRG